MPGTTLAASLLPSLDPASFELLWSASLIGLVLAGGVVALAMLPWRDEEIAQVDAQARSLAARPLVVRWAQRAYAKA